MHDGCSGKFDDGMQVLAKLRMMDSVNKICLFL